MYAPLVAWFESCRCWQERYSTVPLTPQNLQAYSSRHAVSRGTLTIHETVSSRRTGSC